MEETKKRILLTASELFMQYGTRSITMDEIARKMAISKKTLYLHFEDKDAIVNEVCTYHLSQEGSCVKAIQNSCDTAMEHMLEISDFYKEEHQRMNSSLLFDLQRYHPKAWAMFSDYKAKYITEGVATIIRRGVEEGVFRSDISANTLSRWRSECIQMPFDQSLFPPISFQYIQVGVQIAHCFIRGLATVKGLERYEIWLRSKPATYLLPDAAPAISQTLTFS